MKITAKGPTNLKNIVSDRKHPARTNISSTEPCNLFYIKYFFSEYFKGVIFLIITFTFIFFVPTQLTNSSKRNILLLKIQLIFTGIKFSLKFQVIRNFLYSILNIVRVLILKNQ